MPFKNRLKQLRYMRKHAKENRELLKTIKAKEKLKHDLTSKMISFARQFIQERRNYSIEAIPKFKGGMLLEKHFMIGDKEALKKATEAACNLEDELIRNSTNVKKIGVITDLQLSFLNDKVGVVWEKITPLTNQDLIFLKEGKLL